MSLNQITFYKFKKDDMSGVESHKDFVDTTQLFLFPPNLFNIEAYEIDYYYTWVGGAEGVRYTPGTILDPETDPMPEDGTEFYTAWKEGDRGYLALIYDDITIDISDLLLGANVTYGKNQPFPYGEVTISKQIFNSDDYWASRIEMSLYQGDATPITKKPVLKQGSTRVSIGVYGIEGEWEFQRVKDNETTYNLICVHPAHRLKDIALDSLFTLGSYTQTADDAYLTFPNLFGDEAFYFRKGGVLSPNCSYVTGTPPMWIVRGFMGSGADLHIEVGVHKSPTVSKLTGPPSEIFKLLVHLGIGMNYSDMKVDLGTTHIDNDFTFSDTISSDDMDDLKEEQKSIVTNEYLKNTSIRAQGNMWEVIQSLGYLANCEAFFYDKAYFVDYVTPDTSVDKLLLNYENVPAEGWITEEVLNIVDNLDQGSQAIQTSQTVFSENYTTSMAVEGSSKYLIEGKDVKYIYPDTPEEDYVKDRRNFQIKTIALNLLLKNYQPGDVVSYSVSEIKRADVFYDEKEEMNDDLENQSEGIIAQVGAGYFAEYFICMMVDGLTKAWVEFNFNVNPIRDGKYSIYSRANHIKDEQNHLELFDVPLALTTLSYPSCMTTYTWGNPEFLDTEQALTEVESGVADSTKSGTDDTVISDKYSAMMVYGNLSVAEMDEDRDDFTGMILEKNWDVELYQFAGYKDGKIQAMFNTEGKIEAGGGDVVLDEDGLTVFFDGDYGGANPAPQSAFKFKSLQNQNWTSASLFSGMLQVTMPGQETPSKQNLTGLRVYNGSIGGAPKPANLMIANSATGYGPSTTSSTFNNASRPLYCKTSFTTTNPKEFLPEEGAIFAPDVYTGFNADIYDEGTPPSNQISEGGFIFKFRLIIHWGNHSVDFSKFKLNQITFTTGWGNNQHNHQFSLGGSTPQYTASETPDLYIYGVYECGGPFNISLDYDSYYGPPYAPPLPYISIELIRVAMFGPITISDNTSMGNLNDITVNDVFSGGILGEMNSSETNTVTNKTNKRITLYIIQNSVRYNPIFLDPYEAKNIDGLVTNGIHSCCVHMDVSPPSSPAYSDFEMEVSTKYTVLRGDGSIIFLRNDGTYLFGNLYLSSGTHANMNFTPSGIQLIKSILNFSKDSSLNMQSGSVLDLKGGSNVLVNNSTVLNGSPFKTGLHNLMFSNTSYSEVKNLAKNQWHLNNSGGLMMISIKSPTQLSSLKLKDSSGNETDLTSYKSDFPLIWVPNRWSYLVNTSNQIFPVDVYICILK